MFRILALFRYVRYNENQERDRQTARQPARHRQRQRQRDYLLQHSPQSQLPIASYHYSILSLLCHNTYRHTLQAVVSRSLPSTTVDSGYATGLSKSVCSLILLRRCSSGSKLAVDPTQIASGLCVVVTHNNYATRGNS